MLTVCRSHQWKFPAPLRNIKGCDQQLSHYNLSTTPPEDRRERRQLSSESLLRNTEEDMVSVRAAVVVLTFLATCLLASNATTVYHGCCRSYMTTKIPFNKIKGYSVQTVTEHCPINAIIFHTMRGRACTNPALSWVMGYVNRLRNKAELVHIKTSQEQK